MDTKHVLVLFGGKSSEHEVSLNSAKNVVEAIDKNRYEVTLICITVGGKWQMVDSVREANRDDTHVSVDVNVGTFVAGEHTIKPDVVFPVLHGKFGEDGTLQGLLDLMSVPYVGCGVEASAICMDKIRAKRLLQQAGIPVVTDVVIDRRNQHEDIEAMAHSLGSNMWFVKPSRAGSSVGVTNVKSVDTLRSAVADAMQHDDEVLIEAAVGSARELEVAIIGNYPTIQVSGVGEVIPGEDFYSYNDKYSSDSTSKVVTSADIAPEFEGRVRDMAASWREWVNGHKA